MKEGPILFNAPMVRALLDGSKTQTRRALKPQPKGGLQRGVIGPINGDGNLLVCKFGGPGDRLWVRETWRGVVKISPPDSAPEYGVARYVPDQEHCRRVEYVATQARDVEPWRPSIHMPRWASRILLEIVSVRIERLQGISEVDAMAEGIQPGGPTGKSFGIPGLSHAHYLATAREAYCCLWNGINGPGSWDANPWVWVVEFKRI